MTQATSNFPAPQQVEPTTWVCEDFEIEIRSIGKPYERYEVQASCGGSKVNEPFEFPFKPDELEDRIDGLQKVLRRRIVRSLRPDVSTSEDNFSKDISKFGAKLFKAIFSGEVARLYERHRATAAGKQVLRIRLAIEPPELADVPWEFFFDEQQEDYICHDRQTSIVRDPLTKLSLRPLRVEPPLRILGMVAQPEGTQSLQAAQEQHWLHTALQPLADRKQVILEWVGGQTWRDLDKKLQEETWHIFHYIGHASYNQEAGIGEIHLADEAGELRSQDTQQLVRMLRNQPNLRLVVLNACESAATAAALVKNTRLPSALAMQYRISDHIAVELTRNFYEALINGSPIDLAIWRARYVIAQEHQNSFEWGTPVLYMGKGQGQIFDPLHTSNMPVDSQSFQSGLIALKDLLTQPEVRSAVSKFRNDFQAVYDNVDIVKDYKELHDLLQDLEMACYAPIRQAASNYPQDDEVLEFLEGYASKMQLTLDELQAVANHGNVASSKILWKEHIEHAHVRLVEAIEQPQPGALAGVIGYLKRALTYLSVINDELNRAIHDVRLYNFVEAVDTIDRQLSNMDIADSEQAMRFRTGARTLPALTQQFASQVERHTQWQVIDHELERDEQNLATDLDAVILLCPHSTKKIVPMCNYTDQWAVDLIRNVKQLNNALAEQEPNQTIIRRRFRKCRRAVSHRFRKVDLDLKELCGELSELRDPLNDVVIVLESFS